MCGIFVYIGCRYSLEELKKATHTLNPRGPDNFRYFLRNLPGGYIIYMGFQRLCINDLHASGDQPMFSKDGKKILVCNGEIYNYKDLLHGDPQSTSDCEGIIHLYESLLRGTGSATYGSEKNIERISSDLDGVFAYVLHDMERERLLISRDPVGVRPMFHSIIKATPGPNMIRLDDGPLISEYVFASEMKAIHALNNQLRIAPFTPGTVMMIQFGNATFNVYEKSYWNVHDIRDAQSDGINVYADESVNMDKSIFTNEFAYANSIRDSLTSAVRKRLLSDRPIGCLLSGGLDSSLIAALVQKCMREKDPDFVLQTFSVGMSGSTDLAYAQKVANHIGSNHTEVVFTPEEGIAVIPELIGVLETYDVTTVRASVGMYLVSKWISENTDITVVFSGEGADEVAQGYIYFHKAPSPQEANKESRRLINDMHMYDVLRADRTISHWGLEARVPFLDKQFIKSYLQIPAAHRTPGIHMEKYQLRKAFHGGNLIPDEVLWRRKEAFSDGVSSTDAKLAWHNILSGHVDMVVSDEEYHSSGQASLLPPYSKEQYYYWKCFNAAYPGKNANGELIPYIWMPKWMETNDPSARTLSHY